MYKTIKNASKRMVNLLRLDRFFIIYGNRQGINSLSRDDLLSRNPMVMHFRPVTEQPPQFIDRAPTQRLPPAGWGGAPRSSPPQFMRNVSGHEGYGDRSASGRSNDSVGTKSWSRRRRARPVSITLGATSRRSAAMPKPTESLRMEPFLRGRDLLLHRLHVEACAFLHRRKFDEGLGIFADLLLDIDEAPELVHEEIIIGE